MSSDCRAVIGSSLTIADTSVGGTGACDRALGPLAPASTPPQWLG